MGIRLFTSWYSTGSDVRDNDNLICLAHNLANPLISAVHLIVDCAEIPTHPLHPKIEREYIGARIRYNDGFKLMEQYPDDINILANSDIFFDESLECLARMKAAESYVLTRWDITPNGPVFLKHSWSQDAWIFKGVPRDIKGDFELGRLGCDGRIAYEIMRAGYLISNPSRTIKAYHLHSEARPGLYGGHDIKDKIPPPRLPVSSSALRDVGRRHAMAKVARKMVIIIENDEVNDEKWWPVQVESLRLLADQIEASEAGGHSPQYFKVAKGDRCVVYWGSLFKEEIGGWWGKIIKLMKEKANG